ncbi:hypothetical protein EXS65_04185 [Candidatus Peribacteria bacterium]|nr:hypothetical protein [Candidatus Peribacteria bacterium]
MVIPAVMFFLFLSLAGNAFLVVTRDTAPSVNTLSSSSAISSSSSALGPIAFGDVLRPISMTPRLLDASGSVQGASEYVLPEGILPAFPEAMRLYRDQGVAFDRSPFGVLFRAMGAPVDPVKMQLSPDTYLFRSADGMLKLSLSIPTRTLVVTRAVPSVPTPPPERADDDEVMALAKTFAASLNIDLTSLGTPYITETPQTVSQPRRTFVVWPMSIGSYPVYGPDGSPVPALTMQIGRVSHRAISASLSLLSPHVLAVSEYPTLQRDILERKLRSGGLLPMPRNPDGDSITYADLKIVYLLMPQDDKAPTYLVPAMKAAFLLKGIWFATFVPLLDQKHFNTALIP